MLSGKESFVLGSSSVATAVYKGTTVSVYTVDKTDIILTRQDIIQLIDVCILFSRALRNTFSSCHYISSVVFRLSVTEVTPMTKRWN